MQHLTESRVSFATKALRGSFRRADPPSSHLPYIHIQEGVGHPSHHLQHSIPPVWQDLDALPPQENELLPTIPYDPAHVKAMCIRISTYWHEFCCRSSANQRSYYIIPKASIVGIAMEMLKVELLEIGTSKLKSPYVKSLFIKLIWNCRCRENCHENEVCALAEYNFIISCRIKTVVRLSDNIYASEIRYG